MYVKLLLPEICKVSQAKHWNNLCPLIDSYTLRARLCVIISFYSSWIVRDRRRAVKRLIWYLNLSCVPRKFSMRWVRAISQPFSTKSQLGKLLFSIFSNTNAIRFTLGIYKRLYGCYIVLKPLIPGMRWSFVVNDFYWCFDIRLTAMSSSEEFSDITDIELIQHINVDCSRLIKLLNGE